ncbi:hypothetical protein [Streptomyces sp. NPDC048565]|uniref:hypothetical protein n=1 Tax=Streptomyces sp. NPDC048565 TaxID=3155266 RepID=UPI003420E6E2
MNSHPYLLNEDRREYERILDQVLRTSGEHPELAAPGRRIALEQLRSMALSATPHITAAAADEYQHYVAVRDEVRESASRDESREAVRSASLAQSTDQGARADLGRRFGAAVLGAGQPGTGRTADVVAPSRWARMTYGRRLLAALLGLRVRPEAPSAVEAASRSPRTSAQSTGGHGRQAVREPLDLEAFHGPGAGLFGAFAVLAPLLTGAAALFFLLIGFILEVVTSGSGFSRSLFAAGWLLGALTVGLIVIWVAGQVVAARRGGRRISAATPRGGLSEEHVEWAAEAWRQALLERGILPFLREVLADPGGRASYWDATDSPVGRVPGLGYSRPSFSGPGDDPSGPPAPRPHFSSPDFASPDFGSPDFGTSDHQPE